MLSCVLMDYVILRLMCTKVYESWRGSLLTRCCIGGLSPIPAGPFSFPSWLFPLPRPAPPPCPSPIGRGVKCEVTPTGLRTRFLGSFFSHRGDLFLSWRVFVSLTELTDLTERFWRTFRTHRRPPAYRIHRTFQLKLAVMFCVIG